MSAFIVGMGAILLIIAIIFVAPGAYVLFQRMRPQPDAQPAQAGSGGALKNPLVWIGVLVALILWFTMDRNLVLGAGVLVGFAALAFTGKGGIWAKIALGVLALSFLLFGARSPEVLEKVQKGATGVVLEGKPIAPGIKLSDNNTPPPPVLQQAPAENPFVKKLPHIVERTYAVVPEWDSLAEDETAPENVPSSEIKLGKRCYVDFADTPGQGVIYAVDYSYPGAEWRRLEMNEHTEFMSVVRIVPLQAGHHPTTLTLKVECRKRAY